MRRPTLLPELAEHTVDRDTWQGMASARVPSAYPVPRIRLPRMLGGLKGVLPATPDEVLSFWWEMDDSSGSAAEISDPTKSVAAISFAGTDPTYQVPPLAPGSTYAIRMPAAVSTGSASIFLEMGTGTVLVLDWWMEGIAQGGFLNPYLELIGFAHWFGMYGDSVSGDLQFGYDGSPLVSLDTWPDPLHVRWEIDMAAGSTVVKFNGSVVATTSGGLFTWDADAFCTLALSPSRVIDTTFDEVKVGWIP